MLLGPAKLGADRALLTCLLTAQRTHWAIMPNYRWQCSNCGRTYSSTPRRLATGYIMRILLCCFLVVFGFPLGGRAGEIIEVLSNGNDVSGIVACPSQRKFITWSTNGLIQIRHSFNGQLLEAIRLPKRIRNVQFAETGTHFLAFDRDTVGIWKTSSVKPYRQIAIKEFSILGCRFSPDGSQLATWGLDQSKADSPVSLKMWDIRQQELRWETSLNMHNRTTHSFAFSADGSKFFAPFESSLVWWNTASGKKSPSFGAASHQTNNVPLTLIPLSDNCHVIEWSAISIAKRSFRLRLWNVNKGQLAFNVPLTGEPELPITQICRLPIASGDKMVVTGRDGSVRLFDKKTLKPASDKHDRVIQSIATSRNGKRFATGCIDWIVKLWDADGKLIDQMNEHRAPIRSLTFSGDSMTLISLADSVVIWKLP